MFTLKFMSSYNDEEHRTTAISCHHYSVYHFKNRAEVTVYKDYTSQDGVTYTVSLCEPDMPHFQRCYVENMNGKTIDRI